jgi:hypothetical protein
MAKRRLGETENEEREDRKRKEKGENDKKMTDKLTKSGK